MNEKQILETPKVTSLNRPHPLGSQSERGRNSMQPDERFDNLDADDRRFAITRFYQ